MKRITTTLLAACMALTLGLAASAAGTVGTGDYHDYNPEGDPSTAGNSAIPGWGYIGPDAAVTPDPDPEQPPVVDPEDQDQYIHVSVPVQILWATFPSDPGAVVSPTYAIRNLDGRATLSVTMKSFDKKDAVAQSLTGLRLDLTGDLALGDVLSAGSRDTTFAKKLAPKDSGGDALSFGIGGAYTGAYPSERLQPQYAMILEFTVDSLSNP